MTQQDDKQTQFKNGCIGCLSIIVLLALGFAGCTALFPAKKQTQEESAADWYKSASFYGCVRVLKKQLRDPGSYQDDGEHATSGDNGTSKVIAWNFRAKNGFGGYNNSTAICKVSKENGGTVSVTTTGE